MGVASGFQGLDSVGRERERDAVETRWRKNEGWRKWKEEGREGDAEKGERKRVAALLKLLCRSLRGGRSADHLLSSTRKLSDANRFVSGRFKRFTIIRADSNSINASSSPPRRARLPSFLHFAFCTRWQHTKASTVFLSSLLYMAHEPWEYWGTCLEVLMTLNPRNVLPNARTARVVMQNSKLPKYQGSVDLNITRRGRKYADSYRFSINLSCASLEPPHTTQN